MYFAEKIIDDIQLNIDNLPQNFDINNSVFFDIETSGLSPKTSFVFLIGLMFYQDNKFIVRQYFANNKNEEIEILKNCIEDISGFEIIYHYNGLSFDIPYVNTRLSHYRIKYQIQKSNSFDIHQYVRKNKDILKLENLKLKSVEKYMGIYREDDLSGKEVLKAYKEFVNTNNNNLRDKMLLHNIEDIINLYTILPIVTVIDTKKHENEIILKIIDYNINITEKNILISGKIENNLKENININNNSFMLTINSTNGEFKLCFNILKEILYYHIKDFKNYYYVPEIDSAVHKSVVKYYDYQEKIKAKKENCYTKQKSKYIKLPLSLSLDGIRVLSENKKNEKNCILITDVEKVLNKNLLNKILEYIYQIK